MKKNVELVVNTSKLEEYAKELSDLFIKTSNRSLNIELSTSKGKTIDSLIKLAEQFNKLGDSISSLIAQTQSSIEKTRETFIKIDEHISMNYFNVTGG